MQNRVKETLALEQKAEADLETARRNVAQATRSAFFGVQSGIGQVKALEAAEQSSQSALDANKLGYQVGVRINIDVLNAQSQLYQTKRDLAQARYNVLLGTLKLRQAAGTLTLDDVQAINALLVVASPANHPLHPGGDSSCLAETLAMKQNESPEGIQIRLALHNIHRAVEDIVQLVKTPEFDLSTPVHPNGT